MSWRTLEEARAGRRRYYALSRLPERDEPCGVPGCGRPRVTEDCCRRHSYAARGTRDFLPNDGIIDWIAVEIAANGDRPVRLTWVETRIAAAVIIARGATMNEASVKLSRPLRSQETRDDIYGIAEAMRNDRHWLTRGNTKAVQDHVPAA